MKEDWFDRITWMIAQLFIRTIELYQKNIFKTKFWCQRPEYDLYIHHCFSIDTFGSKTLIVDSGTFQTITNNTRTIPPRNPPEI